MMKRISFALLLGMFSMVCAQAQSKMATLNHAGEISTFYGSNAFVEAMAAADNGDVITLSSGNFYSATINKAITLRGAGMAPSNDSINPKEPTVFFDNIYIAIPDSVSERLVIEGIFFDGTTYVAGYYKLKNPTFIKSRFKDFRRDAEATIPSVTNGTFLHCRVNECYFGTNSDVAFVNSVVGNTRSYGKMAGSFTNCVLLNGTHTNFTYTNCIFCVNSNEWNVDSDIIFRNCVATSGLDANYFQSGIVYNCTTATSYADVFKTCTSNEYSDTELYELTDEAKAKYLGSDGKPVGLYGGDLPYSEAPAVPQITRCDVARQSTPDGKLSVEIEVTNPE